MGLELWQYPALVAGIILICFALVGILEWLGNLRWRIERHDWDIVLMHVLTALFIINFFAALLLKVTSE